MRSKTAENFPFILVLLGNLWLWRIFSFNLGLGVLLLAATIFLYSSLINKNKYFNLSLILFLTLIFFQWKTTLVQDLTHFDNDGQRVQDMRLREYPPISFKVGEKIVWVPVAWWFEGRSEVVATFRIVDNFFEIIDPSLYFFANHPRERIGIQEFEKFPYIFLPFFVYGLILLFKKEKKSFWFIYFFIPVALISFVGHKNLVGPFSLFPFLAVSIAKGISESYLLAVKKYKENKHRVIVISLLIFILVLIQSISYAIY